MDTARFLKRSLSFCKMVFRLIDLAEHPVVLFNTKIFRMKARRKLKSQLCLFLRFSIILAGKSLRRLQHENFPIGCGLSLRPRSWWEERYWGESQRGCKERGLQ